MTGFPQLHPQKTSISTVLLRFASGCLVASTIALGLTAERAEVAAPKDVELQVGVVQRFGGQANDTITLKAPPGDRLSIQVETAEGKPQTLVSDTAALAIVPQALPEARIEERVVFSTHRSFESAEEDANRWRAAGIPVELAQPNRWQVWAKREVYSTPLLRRLLLQSVQAKGIQTAFLDTKVLPTEPQAVVIVNGQRYARDQLKIRAGQGKIQVTSKTGDSDRTTRLYAGSLRLQPNAYGSYTLVNQVPLEAYLRGVVPHEIGTFAAQPVLEVQAILARTYALRNLRRFEIDNYQLCADTQCQVYFGLGDAHPKTDRAIAATRGKVLTYQNELVDAVYSANTGGVTAEFDDVWQGANRPYLTTKIDSVANSWDLARKPLTNEQNFRQFLKQKQGFNEADQKWFRWRYDSTIAELNQDLREYLKKMRNPLANFQTIQRLAVVERAPSGRVQKLQVTTDQGTITLEKDNILIAFYAPASLLFQVDPLYNAQKKVTGYAFAGGGLGHGVGLSQTGSYHLGKLGWSSDRILSFYYPGTQLQPINNAIVFWRNPAQLQSANPNPYQAP
ncbi:MAG: SpoIID/LytB domain-containing protein [Leptolyngbyaceae cyanobacterium bins.302]|nr:SpoIID/LytB domain-containing protein [Leptolyngbyaceae cyanobacterium bins.302]